MERICHSNGLVTTVEERLAWCPGVVGGQVWREFWLHWDSVTEATGLRGLQCCQAGGYGTNTWRVWVGGQWAGVSATVGTL